MIARLLLTLVWLRADLAVHGRGLCATGECHLVAELAA